MGFVPHIWPRKRWEGSETWSEWQDLNLRPPRPERVSLTENLTISVKLSRLWRRLFTFGCSQSFGKIRFPYDRVPGVG
jgi:hypothetical protein